MIKKVNKNKFGVIEYSITNAEDLEKLPKGDTDNSVYAVDDENKVYLYSKKANDYILINGGGATNSNGLSIKPIDMGDSETEVNLELFNETGYYSVIGAMYGLRLHNSIVHLNKTENELTFTLYEYGTYLYFSKDSSGIHYNNGDSFIYVKAIGDFEKLPESLQPCNNLIEAIVKLYNLINER